MARKILIAAFVLANVALLTFAIWKRHTAGHSVAGVAASARELPSAELTSADGRTINTRALLGSPLFVQFVNPEIDAQVESVARVRREGPRGDLSWLLITTDARRLASRLPAAGARVIVVEKDYEALRRLFEIPECCEEWRLFDAGGRLKFGGKYQDDDTASKLRSVVDGEQTYAPDLFREALAHLDERGQAGQVRAAAARSRSGRAVVAFFSAVGSACGTGEVLDLLNRRAAQSREVEFIAVLPESFTPTDARNLAANLGLAFPVERAGGELAGAWSALGARYGEEAINGTVVLIDGGKAVAAARGVEETEQLLRRVVRDDFEK